LSSRGGGGGVGDAGGLGEELVLGTQGSGGGGGQPVGSRVLVD